MGKLKSFKQTFLPLTVEGSNQKNLRDCNVYSQWVVTRYNNTGTMFINRYMETKVAYFENKSPMQAFKVKIPWVISLHDNGVLQTINVNSLQCEQKSLPEAVYKEVRSILYAEPKIILLSSRKCWILDSDLNAASMTEIDFQQTDNEVCNITDDFSAVIEYKRLLIGDYRLFQVWNISKNPAVLELEGQVPESNETWVGISVFDKTIVARSFKRCRLWSLDDESPSTPIEIDMEKDTFVTAIHLETNLMVVGDNLGNLFLRLRRNGESVHQLNIPNKMSSEPTNTFEIKLDKRITSIQKRERLVYAGCENGHLYVYDIGKVSAFPILDFNLGEPVRTIEIYDTIIIKSQPKEYKFPNISTLQFKDIKTVESREISLIEEKTDWYGKKIIKGNSPVKFLEDFDGKIFSVQENGEIFWRRNTEPQQSYRYGRNLTVVIQVNQFLYLALSENGKGYLAKFDMFKSASEFQVPTNSGEISALGMLGTIAIIGEVSGLVTVFDTHSKNILGSFKEHSAEISGLLVDQYRLFTSSADKTIKIWAISKNFSLDVKVTLVGHTAGVSGIFLKSPGEIYSYSQAEQVVKLWEVSGTLLRTIAVDGDIPVNFHGIFEDNLTIPGADFNLNRWNLRTGKIARTYSGNRSKIVKIQELNLRLHRFIFSGSENAIRQIDWKSGEIYRIFRGCPNLSALLAVKDFLVTGNSDGIVRRFEYDGTPLPIAYRNKKPHSFGDLITLIPVGNKPVRKNHSLELLRTTSSGQVFELSPKPSHVPKGAWESEVPTDSPKFQKKSAPPRPLRNIVLDRVTESTSVNQPVSQPVNLSPPVSLSTPVNQPKPISLSAPVSHAPAVKQVKIESPQVPKKFPSYRPPVQDVKRNRTNSLNEEPPSQKGRSPVASPEKIRQNYHSFSGYASTPEVEVTQSSQTDSNLRRYRPPVQVENSELKPISAKFQAITEEIVASPTTRNIAVSNKQVENPKHRRIAYVNHSPMFPRNLPRADTKVTRTGSRNFSQTSGQKVGKVASGNFSQNSGQRVGRVASRNFSQISGDKVGKVASGNFGSPRNSQWRVKKTPSNLTENSTKTPGNVTENPGFVTSPKASQWRVKKTPSNLSENSTTTPGNLPENSAKNQISRFKAPSNQNLGRSGSNSFGKSPKNSQWRVKKTPSNLDENSTKTPGNQLENSTRTVQNPTSEIPVKTAGNSVKNMMSNFERKAPVFPNQKPPVANYPQISLKSPGKPGELSPNSRKQKVIEMSQKNPPLSKPGLFPKTAPPLTSSS